MIDRLIEILGKSAVLSSIELSDRYTHIWAMDESLSAKALVLPKTTEEISQVLKLCYELGQSVIVHGGLTNLVGSTETIGDEVIISMERMNKIEEVDANNRTLTVQAGVILETIQDAARNMDMLFPLNFGAKGSCQIGGCISTIAGGLRVLRYGMTRNMILGLEAVLADGTIISNMKKIIKDNSAYDIKQLFIGSEGTLGIVTRAVLKLVESPSSRNSAFIGINDYHQVIKFLKFSDSALAGSLSGYELIWKNTYMALTSPPSLLKPPLSYNHNYFVLIESLGADQQKDAAVMEKLLIDALDAHIIQDAVMAHSDSDLNWFWNIREDVGIINARSIFNQHFDVSIPIDQIGSYVDLTQQRIESIEDVKECFAFGHVADGNIHFIVGKTNSEKALTDQINDIVYGDIQSLGGSVSAEHGIGLHKKNYLHLCRSSEEIELMRLLKNAMDPKRILNPGKVLD